MPTKARAAFQISSKARAASSRVTVPRSSEATAPIPAAVPRLIPLGCLIMRNSVKTKIAIEIIAVGCILDPAQ